MVWYAEIRLVTVQWYLVSEQAYVQAIWQSMLGFGGITTSLLGFAFYHINGKKAGLVNWQWMTVTLAILSSFATVLTFLFLPDSPAKARWADSEERTRLIERVRPNNQGIRQKEWKRHQIIEALLDPFTWLMFLLAFFNTLVVGGIGKFSSLLINQAFGFDTLQALLLGIPQSVFTIALFYIQGLVVFCDIGHTIMEMTD